MFRGNRILDWMRRAGRNQFGPDLSFPPECLPAIRCREVFTSPAEKPALGPLWQDRREGCNSQVTGNVFQVRPVRNYDTLDIVSFSPEGPHDLGIVFRRLTDLEGWQPVPLDINLGSLTPDVYIPENVTGFWNRAHISMVYGNQPIAIFHCGCIVPELCLAVNLMTLGACPEPVGPIPIFGAGTAAGWGGGPYGLFDDFNRPDGGTSLGTAELGGNWVNGTGMTWSISANRAAPTLLAGGVAVTWLDRGFNLGFSSHARANGFANGGVGFPGLIGRVANTTNWLGYIWNVDRMKLMANQAGVLSVLAAPAAASTPPEGALLELWIRELDGFIQGSINGVPQVSTTTAILVGRTRYGLWADDLLNRLDNFTFQP